MLNRGSRRPAWKWRIHTDLTLGQVTSCQSLTWMIPHRICLIKKQVLVFHHPTWGKKAAEEFVLEPNTPTHAASDPQSPFKYFSGNLVIDHGCGHRHQAFRQIDGLLGNNLTFQGSQR